MTEQKKRHLVTDLKIAEVSLCDFGSNSEYDPVTKKRIARSTVALHKRDSDGGRYLNRDELVRHMRRVQDQRTAQRTETKKKEKKMSQLEKILKSAPSRDAICEVIKKRAEKRASRKGVPVAEAEAAEWQEHPEAAEAYESAPKGEPRKPEQRMTKVTNAEAILDQRARKRMRKTGESYAHACASELQADPTLYQKYEKELAAGTTYAVPEPAVHDSEVVLGKSDGNDDDDGECPKCQADVDEDDSYCASCGTKLTPAA